MHVEDFIVLSFYIIVFLILMLLGACVRLPAKPISQHVNRVCVLRLADRMCWVDQAAGDGIKLEEMDGYFAESPDDLTDMITRMHCEP